MSKKKTRASCSHSVFGRPLEELPLTELPTRLQVARHCIFLKNSKYANHGDIIPNVAVTITNLWNRAGIPTLSLKSVKTQVQRVMTEGSHAAQHSGTEKTKKFKNSLNQLFDIAGCRCHDISSCTCEKETKVPQRELKFLIDQRTTRMMCISSVDTKETTKMMKRKSRDDRMKVREDEEKRRKLEMQQTVSSDTVSKSEQVSESESELVSESESEVQSENESEFSGEVIDEVRNNRNNVPIPTLALEADRYGVSNRAAAAIGTATLIDYGIILNSEDKTNIIDHKKVWRARQNLRKELREEPNEVDDISAIFFDGRKDKTLVKEKLGTTWYSKTVSENHYVVIGEPGTSYLCHLTVEEGTAAGIADALLNTLTEMNIAEKIYAVGADSTNVNTGCHKGAIHQLECKIGRCLQWLVCYLHLNELPLRHLCTELIGPTEGPNQFKGELGKALTSCESLPVSIRNIKRIENGNPLPDIDLDELSRDQSYLYRIITAVQTGEITDGLVREKPGAMSHARWLTTASRICRLYLATARPSKSLYTLTHFVVCNYGPMWFKIKCNPKCTDGAKNLLEQIKLQPLLSPETKKITWPVIQRNAYWAHPENVLLAILADDDMDNRRTAIDIIKTVRQQPEPTVIRKFRPPHIKKTTQTLKDLLPSPVECKSETPLTKMLSDEVLERIVEKPLILKIPCHSQGVERCIRMVTEASRKVYGIDARDGYIKAGIKSRSFMPSFDSKQDFQTHFV